MAKNAKTTKRKKPSRPLARKQAERKIKLKPRVRVPRERPLPGMEDKRIVELDDLGHEIRENLETINSCQESIDALRASALKSMRKHSKETWTASGVVFTLKHGEDKLLIKQARSKDANSGDREDEQDDPQPATTDEMATDRAATSTTGVDDEGDDEDENDEADDLVF